MKQKILRLAVPIFVLFFVGTASTKTQKDEAKEWLKRMVNASQTLNYEGTFVYVQGEKLEAMHIIQSSGEDGERQRLYSLNGAVREVLVADDLVTCLLPEQEVYVLASNYNRSPFPISLPRELRRLESYYQFEMLGHDRIAGLDTHKVAIQPRDEFRFGYRLWLENDTGMVLRSALLNEQGHILEQLMFTNFQLNPEIDETLLWSPDSQEIGTKATDKATGKTVTESNWLVKELPEGFVRVLHKRYTKAPHYVTEHIVFTDGLATVSVFVEKLDGAEPLLIGPSRMGAMNAFGVVVDQHQVVVMGEVPKATVEMVASSLDFQGNASTK